MNTKENSDIDQHTSSALLAYLQKQGSDLIGIPVSPLIFISWWAKFFNALSLQSWGFTKQAIAQTFISMPWKSCFPRISQAPEIYGLNKNSKEHMAQHDYCQRERGDHKPL